ncbi:MAG: transglycosylase SLT domain-containing protein [Cyanobacteria bacterium NC_groundwater_1444_Ag_S-0.65um_54_12]|nr:transglycosylase SLT domain-containing protein [Cyanobacteria bacterium NC_groundwater_1444_Ag_S-0.65um_54_12]
MRDAIGPNFRQSLPPLPWQTEAAAVRPVVDQAAKQEAAVTVEEDFTAAASNPALSNGKSVARIGPLLRSLRTLVSRLDAATKDLWEHLSGPAEATDSPPAVTGQAGDPLPATATYTVRPKDTLWRISRELSGDGRRWRAIYELNRDQIADPDLILPGMVLRLPGAQMPPPEPSASRQVAPSRDAESISAGLAIPPAGTNPDRASLDELFNRVADRFKIPRPILKAIALRESNWRQYDQGSRPVSGHNKTGTDWGLMQINDYWHPHAFPRAKNDVVFNLLYGARYLARQYRRYGSWSDAVAAYNAGSAKRSGGHYINQEYVDYVLGHGRAYWI